MIEISHNFQSAVNIEYDFNDIEKISGFIPTSSALEIIDNILMNTETEHLERAKILTGAYGRGKSHTVLVALSILYNKDKSRFENLLDKIRGLNENVYQRISNYIASKSRLLPVIINGNSGNLTQSFLGALQRALKLYDLEDIMPETHFAAALNTLEMWEKQYPETHQKFVEMIGTSVSKFKNSLKANDVKAYHTFSEVYPQLTSGSIFNPFVGFNVVDVYDKVNTVLKEKGFSGMYVVYDEFGKYLESNITSATESETKMLQDFAEKCNREASQQLHLLLICHKDISNYIDTNLPQEKVNGWRGISGRFEHISVSNHFHQMYEIIAYTIGKNPDKWNVFQSEHENQFSELLNNAQNTNFLSGKDELVVYDCYPLHPVTSFILPRLSERIAQNERTLFTFLTSNQKNTLRQFVDNCEEDFPIVTPDYLYDYFEQELRKELNSSEIHKVYSISSRILSNVEKDTLASKIVKTIAVIYFVQQFERIAPTVDVISSIFNLQYGTDKIMHTIDELINQAYIVYIKNSNHYMCLKESSGIDVNAEISHQVEKLKSEMSIEDALNSCTNNNYFYPVRHNETNCLTRYFGFKFISFKNFINNQYDDSLTNGESGHIQAVFCENVSELETLKTFPFCTSEFEVLIVPDVFQTIEDIPYQYLAAIALRNLCSAEDAVLQSEYDMIIEDLENVIYHYISIYTHPEMQKVKYYHHAEVQPIYRRSHLTELLSQICDEVYPHTPIINNESLNKDTLPSMAINSRTKLIKAILENDDISENLGLVGSGQEVSFLRSALIRTHILYQKDGVYRLDSKEAEPSIQYVLRVIETFFSQTAVKGETAFSELYHQLTSYEGKIGMKKGAIPVYIAVVLHDLKQYLVFKCNGTEIKISADSLNSINLKPESYSVMLEDWNDEKSSYIQKLSEIFSRTINENEKQYNSFTYIVNAMSRWYLSLPKCSKLMKRDYLTGKKITNNKLRFVNSLNANLENSHDYLMKQLPGIFSRETVEVAIADFINGAKKQFDNGKSLLLQAIIEKTKVVFSTNQDASLYSILHEWYDKLSSSTLEHLFPNQENAILNMIKTVANDEIVFAERIGKAVTGLRVDDWDESVLSRYVAAIERFKSTVDEYNAMEHTPVSDKQKYKIVIVDEDGTEHIKSFEKTEYSKFAKLLYQDITGAIEDMGQSITEQEKRQVLIEILSELC